MNGYPEVRDERLVPLFEATRDWLEEVSWEMPNGVFGTPTRLNSDAIVFRGTQSFQHAQKTQHTYDQHRKAAELELLDNEESVERVYDYDEAEKTSGVSMWTNEMGHSISYGSVDEVVVEANQPKHIGDTIEFYCRVPFESTVTTLPKLWIEFQRIFDSMPIDIEQISRETEAVMGEINM